MIIKRNQYVVVSTKKYFKLTETIPTSLITTTNRSYIFLHVRIILHQILTYTITENGRHHISKFIAAL